MRSDKLFFDRFHNRYRILATLVVQTGMRVGSGRSDDLLGTDMPLLRLGSGREERLVIPGSTWKGVIRTACEAILRSTTPEGAQWRAMACDPFGTKPKGPEDREATRCLGDFPDMKGSAEAKVLAERAFVARGICHACAIFGAEGLASRARFADSLFQASTRLRDGVGINRDLARAEDGIKYNYEIVEPGARVELVVELDNAEPWQVGLILAVIEEVGRGSLRIGGGGSRGLGWLRLERKPQVVYYPTIRHALGRIDPLLLDDEQLTELERALDTFLEHPLAEEAPCTA